MRAVTRIPTVSRLKPSLNGFPIIGGPACSRRTPTSSSAGRESRAHRDRERGGPVPGYAGPIADVDIHHRPKSDRDLAEYLPKDWQAYVRGNGISTLPLKPPQASP